MDKPSPVPPNRLDVDTSAWLQTRDLSASLAKTLEFRANRKDALERLEEGWNRLFRDTDSGVGDLPPDQNASLVLFDPLDPQGDGPARRKLDRVPEQVDEDLTQSWHVPHDGTVKLVDVFLELETLLGRGHGVQTDVGRQLVQAEGPNLEVELAGFDLAHVLQVEAVSVNEPDDRAKQKATYEHLTDELEKNVARSQELRHKGALRLGQFLRE